MTCIKCGKPAYQFKGKTYKLCASCGWEALVKLMGYVDDSPITDREKVDKVMDYVPLSGLKDKPKLK